MREIERESERNRKRMREIERQSEREFRRQERVIGTNQTIHNNN